jgi:hypothetical protein
MNSNAAVFGLQESGYGSPGGGYPTPTPEQLQAFYGAAVGAGGGSGSAPGAGAATSPGEPGSPSPYGLHGSASERQAPPETKYEPSHSPTHAGQSGIISSDNGLQYANLDGSGGDLKAGYPSGSYSAGSHPHQASSYQGHHASLLQASYAHHYGRQPRQIPYQKIDNYLLADLPDSLLGLKGL